MQYRIGDIIRLKDRTKYNITRLDDGKCSLFIVIDVNHENTINTIDLQTLNNGIIRQPFDLNTNIYKDSSIRKYLNKEYYEGFMDVAKRLMLPMNVKSNGDILEDKVKLISMAEMGLYQYRINGKILYDCDEGDRYSLYRHMIHDRGPECVAQMTRSSYCDKSVWRIGDIGDIIYLDIKYDRYAAPIIRLGKQ